MADDEPFANRLSTYEMCSEGGDQSILEDMLDNPEADAALAEAAIERAIARGVPEELANRLYGHKR